MSPSLEQEIARLRTLTVGELRARYAQAFGEAARSFNKPYLFKRIAYRLQEQAFGTISERARRRAAELLDETTIRRSRPLALPEAIAAAPASPPSTPVPARDPRLPPVGTILLKEHGGRTHRVLVCPDSFEYEGTRYRSLSAIARKVTGAAWNGFLWFGLAERARAKGA